MALIFTWPPRSLRFSQHTITWVASESLLINENDNIYKSFKTSSIRRVTSVWEPAQGPGNELQVVVQGKKTGWYFSEGDERRRKCKMQIERRTAPSINTPIAGWNTHCHKFSQVSNNPYKPHTTTRHQRHWHQRIHPSTWFFSSYSVSTTYCGAKGSFGHQASR